MEIPFKRANILLPKKADMKKWSVVACDQYTSEQDYWDDVEKIVGDKPSTLRLTLQEMYLNEPNIEDRIQKINNEMEKLYSSNFFEEYENTMFYIERKQENGKIREGL